MRLVLALIVALIAVVLAVQNAPAVIIRLFFWQVEAPLAVIIAVSFAAGIVVSLLASVPKFRRMRAHERELSARAADASVPTKTTPVAKHGSGDERTLRANQRAS